MKEKLEQVKQQFTELQDYITSSINQCESQTFYHDEWTYDVNDASSAKAKKPEGGGCSRVLEGGEVFEKAGVNFSSLKGHSLPKAATEKRPELIDCEFYATGVSIVIHPNNPFIPTSHANVRFFIAETPKGSVWWFGGGFDLTPYYPFTEDCIAWHQQAKQTCDAYDISLYPKFKKQCDDYFYLKHRDEHRGIGGLFYDDFNELGFDKTLAMSESVGKTFIDAYMAIVSKRQHTPFTQEQRDFQCYRRGRYVEFNLVYDRGTIFGLQSNGRTESILMSLPPVVNWHYDKQFADDSAEKKLTDYYLKPQDWANLS